MHGVWADVDVKPAIQVARQAGLGTPPLNPPCCQAPPPSRGAPAWLVGVFSVLAGMAAVTGRCLPSTRVHCCCLTTVPVDMRNIAGVGAGPSVRWC